MKFLCFLLVPVVLAQVPKLTNTLSTDEKITTYQKWVASDSFSASNRLLLASAYIQKTRETTDFSYLDRASKIVNTILESKATYEAQRLRNLIELSRHEFSKVAEHAREMTVAAPNDPQNWGTLGDALMELGQYEKALPAFQKMNSLRANLFSWNRLAYYRFVTGDSDGALAIMNDAVRAGAPNPENKAWCLSELGAMHFKLGHLDQAEASYREAIAAFDTLHAAHAGLGAILAARGDLEGAVAAYRRAKSITPLVQYSGALHDLFEAQSKPRETHQEAAQIDLLMKLEEASGQKANRTLALILANQERELSKALEIARADLEVRKDIYTWDALGWVLLKNGKLEEAAKASQEALKTGAKEPLLLYHSGMIARAQANNPLARAHLAAALALNPGFDFKQSAIARKTLQLVTAESRP